MKKTIVPLLSIALFFTACNGNEQTTSSNKDSTATATVDAAKDWKFGVALWTFHTFSFDQALDKVDSSGLKYIEPNTFHKAGVELKDTLVGKLSPAGIGKLKELIAKKGLTVSSIYLAGDSTLASWIHQFDIAKQLGVAFVTAEPPLNMWDSIDSLAGATICSFCNPIFCFQ
ncbi:MAG: sugar phosphate isomerase/epimerase [Ferruginibacter sp.]|nr:sugar phosphate isomerase/epimerase [Ferruginibacter sp.]